MNHNPISVTMEQTLAKKVTVKTEYPPNIVDLANHLPGAMDYGIIFTYGDTIYNPSNVKLTPELMAHEATHACQQEQIGPEDWWSVYYVSAPFRLEQELEAHVHEYMMYASTHNRHQCRAMLKGIGAKLAAPLYGKVIKTREAMDAIKFAAQQEAVDWVEKRKQFLEVNEHQSS